MIVTKKAIPRRAMLRGLGATVALPFLDAMVPAFGRLAAAAPKTSRLSTVYIGNGANMKTWTPIAEGRAYEMTPMLEPLAPFRDRMLVLSGLDNKPGLALPGEPAGGHGRIGGSFLTGVHVKPTEGADFEAGISIDQIAARELGQKTELASLELSLDTTEFAGACDAGFSCAYTTTLCWRGPTAPVPMEHDPRAVFERLFGDSGSTDRAERLSRLTANRSILDSVTGKLARLQRDLGGRDREKLTQYVDAIRDVERRIQRAEEQSARELPVVEQPAGAPDSFEAYARVMFDLQVLALQSDLTRVITFQLASELSARTYPEAGVADPHHGLAVAVVALLAEGDDRVEQLARQLREHARILDEPLVPPAVEEQRTAVAVACELDLAEEEGVISSPVGAHDSCDEVRECALDQRCLMDHLERRLGKLVGHAAREAVGEAGLLRLEHAHAEARSLVEQRPHPRPPVDRDENERGLERDRHERVRRHAVHLLADPGREHRHARGEHPECSPEGESGVALETLAELQRLGHRCDVVRRSERLRRRDGARHRDLELRWPRAFHACDCDD